MELNQEVLTELVATKMADEYDIRALVGDRIQNLIDKRISSAIAEHANKMISEATERAFANWREIKLHRTNNWGEAQGEAVSLPEWCEQQILRRSTPDYGGKSPISQDASKIVCERVTKVVDELLKVNRAALNEMVNQTLAAEIAKRVSK